MNNGGWTRNPTLSSDGVCFDYTSSSPCAWCGGEGSGQPRSIDGCWGLTARYNLLGIRSLRAGGVTCCSMLVHAKNNAAALLWRRQLGVKLPRLKALS